MTANMDKNEKKKGLQEVVRNPMLNQLSRRVQKCKSRSNMADWFVTGGKRQLGNNDLYEILMRLKKDDRAKVLSSIPEKHRKAVEIYSQGTESQGLMVKKNF